jgi:cytochrome b involved in lipid metabolism
VRFHFHFLPHLSLCSGCVVFGRVAGDGAASYLLKQYSTGTASTAQQRVGQIANHLETKIRINPEDQNVTLTFSWAGQGGVQSSSSSSSGAPQSSQPGPSSSETSTVAGPEGPGQGKEPPAKKELKEYTMEEVAKHDKNDDAWVVVDGKVLDVTEFLPCVSAASVSCVNDVTGITREDPRLYCSIKAKTAPKCVPEIRHVLCSC